jgi:hypothetical protein
MSTGIITPVQHSKESQLVLIFLFVKYFGSIHKASALTNLGGKAKKTSIT